MLTPVSGYSFSPLLMSMSEAFSYLFYTILHKSSERSSLIFGPGFNSSPPEVKNPGVFCGSATTFHNPAAGHHWPMPPPQTPGQSRASLGQSLMESLILSSGSWCAQGYVCVLQESISPVLCKFWQLYGGVNGDLLQEGLCHPQVCCTQPYPNLLHLEPLPLWQSTAHPYLHRRHSDTVLSQSVWGLWVLVHTRFVSALWASLVGIGFESKCEFAPSTVLLGLLLCPWTWAISSKSLQLHAAAAQVPTVLLGLLCPWTWGISSQPLQNRTAASPSANLIHKSLCCYLIMPCTRSQPKDFYSSSSLCLESSSSR